MDDLPPQKLLTGSLKWAIFALVLASTVGFSSQREFNGDVVWFVDYGALGFGLLTLLLCAVAVRDALQLEQHRMNRLLIAGLIAVGGAWRVLYGLGAFA